jgi:O-succinylbenzoic acid--CoA ligase
MKTLLLNQRSFSTAQLKAGTPVAHSPFEESTLSFCYRWLNGADIFTIATSGSTGSPKNIAFTRQQMEASAKLTARALGLQKGQRAWLCLDTRFVAGQMMLVRSFIADMEVLATEPSANPASALANDEVIDFAALVPYQLQNIITSADAHKLNRLGSVIIGGAALAPLWIERIQSFSSHFYATYGMTETLSHVALQKLNGPDRQTAFHPLPGILLKEDSRGCLVVFAPHVSEQPFVTNDLVKLHHDQSFHIEGRWDYVINSGAVKISPESVEKVVDEILCQLQLDINCLVAGLSDDRFGQKPVLLLESEPLLTTLQMQLQQKMKERLDRYQQPKDIFFIPAFQKSDSGKILRKETVALLAAQLESAGGFRSNR